jgi:hypothetical protein
MVHFVGLDVSVKETDHRWYEPGSRSPTLPIASNLGPIVTRDGTISLVRVSQSDETSYLPSGPSSLPYVFAQGALGNVAQVPHTGLLLQR